MPTESSPADRQRHDRRPVGAAVTVPAMFVAGALAAIQAKVNGELAVGLGSGSRAGATAALLSFGTGLLLLSVVLVLAPRSRERVRVIWKRVQRGTVALPLLAGGVLGALLVAAQTLAVGVLGVSMFVVAFVAGQSISGVVVDHVGLGPARGNRVTTPRVLGAATTVIAVVVASLGRVDGEHALTPGALVLTTLPFVAGIGFALQQAANGRLSRESDSWAAAWNNFAVGTVALAVFATVALSRPGELASPPGDPKLYVGGTLGVVVIWLSATMVRRHGVLVLSLCIIAGQVVTAQIIDYFDPATAVGPLALSGALLTLVGVAVPLLARSRAGKGAPRPGR